MKLMRYSVFALLTFGLFSCSSSEASDEGNNLEDALNELNETLESTGTNKSFRTVDDEYFTIDIPASMKPEYQLNPDAEIQYSYTEDMEYYVKEHYVIVMQETHEEISTYDLGVEFDALSYGAVSVDHLGGGLDEYTILTTNPEVKKLNGMDCVRYEMEGSMGEVKVYYQLAVFMGEKAFYQVLTWTIQDQKPEFIDDMNKIIESFKER